MKRLLTSVLAIASLATTLCLAMPNSAQARPSSGWVATTLDGGAANLRSAPSTNASVLATIRNGSRFSIVNERFDAAGYRWYQIAPETFNPTSVTWIRSDLVSFAAPFAAQPRLSCDAAIAATEKSIRGVSNTRIATRNQLAHGYRDAPAGRGNSYSFILAGGGSKSVLASPVLMNSLAAQLIENCPGTGLVAFSAGGGDYINYGVMPERLVRPFQCKLGANSDRGPAEWGEQICL
ncbi:MAG: SH3 domain-containing protein [Phormidesmis sp.]